MANLTSTASVNRSRAIQRLQKVTDVAAREKAVKKELEVAVAAAKSQGCSWDDIGNALGVSGPGAFQRFKKTIP